MRDINLSIIAASSYGDLGELLQYYWVLMEAPLFATMKSIVAQAAKALGLNVYVQFFNERVQKGEKYLDCIIAQKNLVHTNLVFVTAKSFEIPRAIDIARKLKREGLQVVLGGPGITLADRKIYKLIIDEGLSINVGEGELTVKKILEDAVKGVLEPIYWQKDYINLYESPLPALPIKEEHRYSLNKFCALNTSEGCPHNCSFCCVTKLRGRKVCKERSRDPEACVEWIEQAHRRGFEMFLTSDNFIRSHFYQQLKEGLIKLNERLNNKLYLFVQLDANAINEVRDLRRMGVKSAFFGFETTDQLVLKNENKKHNHPENYKEIVRAFHSQGIHVSSGLMVGFSSQTPASIRADIERFSKEIGIIAYIYAVTPLPGSPDYKEAVSRKELVSADLNQYDTRHFVRSWFTSMDTSQAQATYDKSLKEYFTFKTALNIRQKWTIWARNLKMIFYGRSMAEYGRIFGYRPLHPMLDGFPRRPKVWRPADSFRGFELTAEDLANREKFLESLI